MGYMLDEDVQEILTRSANREELYTYIGKAADSGKPPSRSTIDNAFGKDGKSGVSCELFVRICELINLLTHWRLSYDQFCSPSGKAGLPDQLRKHFRNEKRAGSVAEDPSYWKRLGETYDEFLASCHWEIAEPEKYIEDADDSPPAFDNGSTKLAMEKSELTTASQDKHSDFAALPSEPACLGTSTDPPDNPNWPPINLAAALLVPSAMILIAGMFLPQPIKFFLLLPFPVVFFFWVAVVLLRYFFEGLQSYLFSQGSDSQKYRYCGIVWPLFDKIERFLDSNHSLTRVAFGGNQVPQPNYRLTTAGNWMIEGWLWATVIVTVALMMYFGNPMVNSQGLLLCLPASTLICVWLWIPSLAAQLVGKIIWPWLNVRYSRLLLLGSLVFSHWANLLLVIVLASPGLIMLHGWLLAPFYFLASPIKGIVQGSYLEAVAAGLAITWAFLPAARIILEMYQSTRSDQSMESTAVQQHSRETSQTFSIEEKMERIKQFPSRCMNENRIIAKLSLSMLSWIAKGWKKVKR